MRRPAERDDPSAPPAPDLANPTGHDVRGEDVYGAGAFSASRDGGARRHRGADYIAEPGEIVRAPIAGVVHRIGFAYRGDERYRYVELSDAVAQRAVRVLYVLPLVAVGAVVRASDPIGRKPGTGRTENQRRPPAGQRRLHGADWRRGLAVNDLGLWQKDPTDEESLAGLALETAYHPNRNWTFFARAEQVDSHDLAPQVETVAKASLGALRDFHIRENVAIGIGALYSHTFVPDEIDPAYDGDSDAAMAFVHLRVG